METVTMSTDVLTAIIGVALLMVPLGALLGYLADRNNSEDGLGAFSILAIMLTLAGGIVAVGVGLGHGFYLGVTR